jgi:hypothetical protein
LLIIDRVQLIGAQALGVLVIALTLLRAIEKRLLKLGQIALGFLVFFRRNLGELFLLRGLFDFATTATAHDAPP